MKDSGIRPGQFAVFPGGGGGVGIQAVQLAVAMGMRAIVIDTGSERRELCKKYGAEAFVDFKEVGDTAAEILKLTDGGAHGVFVTAVQSYPTALGYLGGRIGGVVMWYVIDEYLAHHDLTDSAKQHRTPSCGEISYRPRPYSALVQEPVNQRHACERYG